MLTELLLQRPTLSNLLYPEQPQVRAVASSQAASASSTASSALPANKGGESQSSEAAFALDLSPSALALSRSRPALLGEASVSSAQTADSKAQSGSAILNGEEGANSSSEGADRASSDKTAKSTAEGAARSSKGAAGEETLSEEDQRKVEELKDIDRKVHVHEHTHLAAAGGYARGGAQFQYVSGPDGDRYAVAGHVNMDTGREHSPEATLRKAQTVRKAALAPADPSSADRQIAANMAQMAGEARSQIAEESRSQVAEESKAPAEGASAQGSSEKPDYSAQPSDSSKEQSSGSASSASKDNEAPKADTSSTSQLRRDGVPWGAAAYQAASQSAYAQSTGSVQAAVSYESIALVA